MLHDLTTNADHPHRLLEGQHSSNEGRADFPEAMADDCRRRYPTRLPELIERNLHREERRLRDLGRPKAAAVAVTSDLLDQTPSNLAIDEVGTPLQGVPKHRFPIKELAAHAGPLGALIGKGHYQPASRSRRASGCS